MKDFRKKNNLWKKTKNKKQKKHYYMSVALAASHAKKFIFFMSKTHIRSALHTLFYRIITKQILSFVWKIQFCTSLFYSARLLIWKISSIDSNEIEKVPSCTGTAWFQLCALIIFGNFAFLHVYSILDDYSVIL